MLYSYISCTSSLTDLVQQVFVSTHYELGHVLGAKDTDQWPYGEYVFRESRKINCVVC